MEVNDNRCFKIQLPNGSVVDVLSSVFEEIRKWVQDTESKPESGGYIIGYCHKKSGNYSLESVSHPYCNDLRSPTRFDILDSQHQIFLNKARRAKSYYLGVWHTHPQMIPTPSSVDWTDWRETLLVDQTGCQYVFFIIAGIVEWRLWVGEFETGTIEEVFECEKNSDGIYLRESNEIQ